MNKVLELVRSFYPSVGGLEKFVADRLKIYNQLGLEYKLVSTNFTTEKQDYTKIIESPLYLPRFTPYDFVFGLGKVLDDDYNILSVNQIGRFFSDYSIIKAKKLGKKIILTPHFHYHTERFGLLKSIHSKVFIQKLFSLVDKIICLTNVEVNYWQKLVNIEMEKFCIIPQYIELDRAYDFEEGNDEQYLLYLGRYEKNKKVDLLIKAFNNIDKNNLSLLLTINISDLPDDLQAIVSKNKNIELLGYISDELKEKYLKNCLALVLPSSYEAFGIVLLEASQFKKPILCSDLPVLREVLDDKGTLFFKNEISDIANVINHFIMLTDLEKEKLGDNNFRNLSRYNFIDTVNKYSKIFESL